MRRGELLVAFVKSLVYAILFFVFLAAFCCSCTTTKYIPVESVKVEYKDNIREIHTTDSITDNRFVYVKGDTVIDYRDRVKWKEKVVRDSVIIERVDSVVVPYPVEKPLTKWQRVKMDFGGMAIGGVLIALCFAVVWLIRRFRK